MWLSYGTSYILQTCMCDKEKEKGRETTHTGLRERETGRHWAMEGVPRCLCPSQPHELILRADGEMGEG